MKRNSTYSGKLYTVIITAMLFSFSKTYAQFPFTQRNTWNGPYDIKMIASPSLEAVYLNPTQAAAGNLEADSVIKYSTMLMSGTLLDINNDYKGGSPFVKISGLTEQAVACPDYDSPCMLGIPTASPSSSCPTKYGSPTTLSDVYVSMTYADYDTDYTTYSSSMAELDISSCSEIQAAYLYWTGMIKGSDPDINLVTPTASYTGSGDVFSTSSTSGFETVKFKRPGGSYQSVTATSTNIRNDGSRYLCTADVTSLLQGTGGGQFWTANVQSYPDQSSGGSTAGWVLVVIFRSPLSSPHVISLWDGMENINSGSSQTFTLTGIQAPATTNFKSYVGFCVLDGENLAAQIGSTAPEGLGFQTNNGGSLYSINPFATDQPPYKLWTKKGYPATSSGSDNIDACKQPLFDSNWASVYDGISSSHITSYNETTGKNGNEIVRLPSNPNTLGLDAHDILLPSGSVASGATQATLTVNAGPQGGTIPFLAFIAIEQLQPKLTMTKTADKNTTTTNSQITYTLRMRNQGNEASFGNDVVIDTLDIATSYVTGSFASTSYKSGAITSPADVSLVSTTNNILQFTISQSILANDSLDITFTVQVADYASHTDLWDVQCKRSILNTAYVNYNTLSSGILQNKSNANDCGIGSETSVLVFDAQFSASSTTTLGPFTICTDPTGNIIAHVQEQLITAGVSSSDVVLYDIRDINYNRIHSTDSFPNTPGTNETYYAIRSYSSGSVCQQIYQISFSYCPQPVKLTYFKGESEASANVLQWATASETNNNYFIIEKSSDGIHYTSIGTVKGNGNSSSTINYDFTDNNITNSICYYRLKQVDYNGAYAYSTIIAIETKGNDIDIFPNPNDGKFTIRLFNSSQPYVLTITDVLGRQVYFISGERVPEHLEINNIITGVYIVSLFYDDNKIVKKMIVY